MKFLFLMGSFLIAASSITFAGWAPAPNSNITFGNLKVVDESGGHTELAQLPQGTTHSLPLILLPIFTQCKMSCPIMAQALKKSMIEFQGSHPGQKSGNSIFPVVILSFDVSDQASDLLNFRQKGGLPPDWRIYRADDKVAVREYFDRFGYQIMSEEGAFNHPNQMFVFNSQLKWIGSIYGTDMSPGDLVLASIAVSQSESSRLSETFSRILKQPENLAMIGGIGLGFGILFLSIFAQKFRKPKEL